MTRAQMPRWRQAAIPPSNAEAGASAPPWRALPDVTMDIDRARAVAERLHAADREEDGTPLLEHIRRAASAVPLEARPVAWLHEALEWTVVPEQELLTNGLSDDQLAPSGCFTAPAPARSACTSRISA